MHTGDDSHLRHTHGDRTWPALADAFHHFLLGCGFLVTRQQLSDHFDEPEERP
jgi:hypothetical protein